MLNLSDRCDRCGAQAFVVAFLKASELMFCAHHGRKYMPTLQVVAEEIYDGTTTINTKASVAAY